MGWRPVGLDLGRMFASLRHHSRFRLCVEDGAEPQQAFAAAYMREARWPGHSHEPAAPSMNARALLAFDLLETLVRAHWKCADHGNSKGEVSGGEIFSWALSARDRIRGAESPGGYRYVSPQLRASLARTAGGDGDGDGFPLCKCFAEKAA